MNSDLFKRNNFDLLRLFAAMQVVLYHVVENLHVDLAAPAYAVQHYLYLFPGVPIFFFISGFLISKSFENNHRISEYAQNRVLRLYPGLIACVSLSFLLIYFSGYMESVNATISDWFLLFLAKSSFLQFYNPDFMRSYGDGVLNGSLWTITVELQFYVMVPLLYGLFKLRSSDNANLRLLILIGVFFLVNRLYTSVPAELHEEIWYKLFRVSFLPWFYMFLTGMLVQRNFAFFYRLFAGRFVYIFLLYSVIGYFMILDKAPMGNNINPIAFVLLMTVVFSFAYSYVDLSRKLLCKNDISYGVYIYHMPIVNFLKYTGYTGGMAAIVAIAATVIVATLSWVFIEKPSLKLKRHPLNPLNQNTC